MWLSKHASACMLPQLLRYLLPVPAKLPCSCFDLCPTMCTSPSQVLHLVSTKVSDTPSGESSVAVQGARRTWFRQEDYLFLMPEAERCR